MKTLPLPAELSALLLYCPETGSLVWKPRADNSRGFNDRYAGNIAGNIDTHGYRRITIGGEKYWAHRLVWRMLTGEQPPMVDHINGEPDDNRIANLRAADHAQNLQNRGPSTNSKTGVKGVHFSKAAKRYTAQICVRRQRLTLGLFDTVEEAAAAYADAAARYHGEFASLGSYTPAA